jgi:hypothetical protein
MFDRDELGIDPETDDELDELECCPNCGEPWEDCECENEEE